MYITVISDTHNQHKWLNIPKKGDIIVHAGDVSSKGSRREIEIFLKWYGDLDYKVKILTPGNHDWAFERNPEVCEELCDNYGVILLNDSGYKYNGVKFWGSPVQPKFGNWAFNRSIHSYSSNTHHGPPTYPHIKPHWDKIPNDTDVLITHGPPKDVLDRTCYGGTVGCPWLSQTIERVKPILHVFGHIHESRGVIVDKTKKDPITYCNGSSLDIRYKPRDINHFIFDIEKLKVGDSKGTD